MDKTFFRRWFNSAAPAPDQETTEALAQRGSAEAQFSLGLRFATGSGAAQDYAQAEHWYLKAASQNHALANFNLGMMHASGQGRPCDATISMNWFQKAADLGDAGAQFQLGEAFHRGVLKARAQSDGQARIDAYKWFRLAADQGYRGAKTACEMVNLDMTHEDVLEGGRRVAAFHDAKTAETVERSGAIGNRPAR